MKKEKIKLLLVEDHNIVREGIKSLLKYEKDLKVIGEVSNGVEAVKEALALKPDLILMDIALPSLNGLEASRQILKKNPKQGILILSAHGDDCYIEKIIHLKIRGYLIKQCMPSILVKAIHQVVEGETYFSPSISKRYKDLEDYKIDHNGKRLVSSRKNSLSPRESQVLQLIAEGKANKQVAFDLNVSIKTIEKHRQNLMRKLNIHDTAGLTRYAISEGLIENSRQRTIL